jgi:hypothetical protein
MAFLFDESKTLITTPRAMRYQYGRQSVRNTVIFGGACIVPINHTAHNTKRNKASHLFIRTDPTAGISDNLISPGMPFRTPVTNACDPLRWTMLFL